MTSAAPEQLPPAAVRQSHFEQGVAYALHLWPALTLAVQNNWGGPDSTDKRDWFAGAIAGLFPDFKDAPPAQPPNTGSKPSEVLEPDLQDVEEVLLQVMIDEFEVNVDDDSGTEIAGHVIRARAQCAVGVWDEVNELKTRFQNRGTKKVDAMFKRVEDDDQDTDWETDDSGAEDDDGDEDGGADVAMSDTPSAPKEKPPPEVDEDGFTKVTKRR